MKCALSAKRSTRIPGTRDQCEDCGRIVYTRKDETYSPHDVPKDIERLRRMNQAWAESRRAER